MGPGLQFSLAPALISCKNHVILYHSPQGPLHHIFKGFWEPHKFNPLSSERERSNREEEKNEREEEKQQEKYSKRKTKREETKTWGQDCNFSLATALISCRNHVILHRSPQGPLHHIFKGFWHLTNLTRSPQREKQQRRRKE